MWLILSKYIFCFLRAQNVYLMYWLLMFNIILEPPHWKKVDCFGGCSPCAWVNHCTLSIYGQIADNIGLLDNLNFQDVLIINDIWRPQRDSLRWLVSSFLLISRCTRTKPRAKHGTSNTIFIKINIENIVSKEKVTYQLTGGVEI